MKEKKFQDNLRGAGGINEQLKTDLFFQFGFPLFLRVLWCGFVFLNFSSEGGTYCAAQDQAV